MQGRNCLTNRLLQYLAKISYSFYLIHMVTMLVVFKIITKVWGERSDYFFIWFIFTLTICIFAAQLLYTMVEKPSARLSKKF
jgi:peptidoglycan/LPS O-acetylase OafA/YrhL